MNVQSVKIARVVRRIPRTWLKEMTEVFLNRGQLLAFIVAVLALWILLKGATLEQRDEQALNWAASVQAVGLAVLIWGAIALVRAPFIIRRRDDERGRWHGGRFVYHRPQLVAVERCIATGRAERFKICFEDAEHGSFVNITIEVEHAFFLPHMFVAVFAEVWMPPIYGQSHLKAGMRLPRDRTAHLVVQMKERMNPETVRVYMHDWTIGDALGHEGSENRPDKVGRTPNA